MKLPKNAVTLSVFVPGVNLILFVLLRERAQSCNMLRNHSKKYSILSKKEQTIVAIATCYWPE